MTITPEQCRAARALLEWKQTDLAKASAVGINTIRVFETKKSAPTAGTLKLLRMAFEEAGIIFIPENVEGPGLRLRK